MIFDVRGRGEGKTRGLLDMLALDPKSILVVHNEQERARVIKLLIGDSWTHPGLAGQEFDKRIATYNDLKTRRLYGKHKDLRVMIDNVDMLLQELVGPYSITFVTATGELA